ncbi:MAG: YbjN domain-containing protein, partial [Myxococcales bacterium]
LASEVVPKDRVVPDLPPGRVSDWVGDVIAEYYDAPHAIRDRDGNIPIRYGSAMVLIRIIEDGEYSWVHFFSPLVSNCFDGPKLLETLNEINQTLVNRKVVLEGGALVVLTMDIPRAMLSKQSILAALDMMEVADELDTKIHELYGGDMMFSDLDKAYDV